ncbi:MAG: hypothetical protein AAFS07_09545 [Pseudomonadota bacterium]
MRHLLALAALVLAPCQAAADPAAAVRAEGVVRGGELAERWCSECHLISPAGPGGDIGPPFTEMTVEEPATEAALRGWLFDPHGPMENVELSNAQISDILVYIRSIRPAAE